MIYAEAKQMLDTSWSNISLYHISSKLSNMTFCNEHTPWTMTNKLHQIDVAALLGKVGDSNPYHNNLNSKTVENEVTLLEDR